MDARLDAEFAGTEFDRLINPPNELFLFQRVRLRRTAALSKATEGAADRADVGDVDVAIDDEADLLAYKLSADLIGGRADLLNYFWARLGEERCQLLSGSPARPCSIAGPTSSERIANGASLRPEPRRGMKLQYLATIVSITAGSIHCSSM